MDAGRWDYYQVIKDIALFIVDLSEWAEWMRMLNIDDKEYLKVVV